MPGTPKRMARRVIELEELALQLNNAFCEAAPKHYFERAQSGPDPHGIRAAWCEGSELVFEALAGLEHLADIMRARAGLKDKPNSERARPKRSREARLTEESDDTVLEDEYDDVDV